MMMNNDGVKIAHIHSRYVRNKLKDMGNKQIDFEVNKKLPQFNVYLFEETDKLLSDLTQITLDIKDNKQK